MEDLETKLNAMLSDPQTMAKISELAKGLQQCPPQEGSMPSLGGIDPALLARLSGLAGQSGIDANQQSLLSALSPYLSNRRISKLEKAMRAAKLATMASSILSTTGISLGLGR